MKAGTALARRYDLSALRFMASVGEPLNAEAVIWSADAFGMPFHDNWWQTETGGIMIANYASMDVKPGSMGRPLPGISAGIVERAARARTRDRCADAQWASLRSSPGWPSMMRAYLNEDGTLSQMLRRRVVSDRRPRDERCGRLLLVRRPGRRRDQDRRPSDRTLRSRERAHGASGGRRGGGDRHA